MIDGPGDTISDPIRVESPEKPAAAEIAVVLVPVEIPVPMLPRNIVSSIAVILFCVVFLVAYEILRSRDA